MHLAATTDSVRTAPSLPFVGVTPCQSGATIHGRNLRGIEPALAGPKRGKSIMFPRSTRIITHPRDRAFCYGPRNFQITPVSSLDGCPKSILVPRRTPETKSNHRAHKTMIASGLSQIGAVFGPSIEDLNPDIERWSLCVLLRPTYLT
jgi:hypothetical protein